MNVIEWLIARFAPPPLPPRILAYERERDAAEADERARLHADLRRLTDILRRLEHRGEGGSRGD